MARRRTPCLRRMRSIRDIARHLRSFPLSYRFPELSLPGRQVPDWPRLLHLYSRMKPGKTVLEWMQEYQIEKLGIDVRRFTSFGVIKVAQDDWTRKSHTTHFHIRVFSVGSTDGLFSYRMPDHRMSPRNVGLRVLWCEDVQRAFLPPCSRFQPSRASNN